MLKYHREGLYCLGFAEIKEQHEQEMEENEAPSLPASSDDSVFPASITTIPGTTTGTADAIATRDNDDRDRGDDDNESSDVGGSDSDSDSGDDSELEDALADRQRWSKRHWIAVGGKEQRISLWDIY